MIMKLTAQNDFRGTCFVNAADWCLWIVVMVVAEVKVKVMAALQVY